MTTKGIPTMYAGIRFRSRLEATWAAFFDLLGWPWEYEPVDLKGYIPDFSIAASSSPVLIDIKPIVDGADLPPRIEEVAEFVGGSDFIVLGSALFDLGGGVLSIGAGPVTDSLQVYSSTLSKCGSCHRVVFEVGRPSWCPLCGDDLETESRPDAELMRALWATAKNRTQWKGAYDG